MPLKLRPQIFSALLLAFASACGASGVTDNVSRPPEGVASKPVEPEVIASQRGPVASALIGPDETPSSGESLVLEGIVAQRIPSDATVRVRLSLPAGVQLLEGSSDQRLPATAAPRTEALRFVIRPSAIPDQDALLIVDLRGDGFGYHAEHRYRFGRKEPTLVAPTRDGPSVQVNGKDLGPSVQVRR